MSTLEYIQLRDKLLKKLIDTTDVRVLEQIKDVFKNNEDSDFFDELPEHVQSNLLESIEESKQRFGTPHNEVMNQFRR